jgi:hypothetical protein
MKVILQILLHALSLFAGFWLASEKTFEPSAKAAVATQQPKSKTSIEVQAFQPPPKASSEAGLALLTYENWAEAIHPISQIESGGPARAAARPLAQSFPEVRRRLLRCLFERWAALDLNGALTALRGLSSPQLKERALWAVLDLWTKSDTEAAWKWVNALEDDSVLQETGIEHLLSLSADKDPLASAAWADQIADVFLREKALTQIGDRWMSNDANGALAALTNVVPKRLRDYLLSKVCHRDGVDHAAGLEIVSQLPTQAERSKLSEEWLSAYVNDHPQDAFQWLLDHSERPELQKSADAVGGYLGATMKNFAELQSYAQQLPSGPIRDAFAARAANEWASAGRSLAEAEQLLALCGPCLERDSAQSTIESKRSPK